MPTYSTADIRNVLLTGQGNCGKTALFESLLFKSGTVNRLGSSPKAPASAISRRRRRNTTFDLPRRPARRSWRQADQPDRHARLARPDRAGDRLFAGGGDRRVVINAHNGIEVVTRRIMEAARERTSRGRSSSTNRFAGASNLEELLSQIQETFGHECLPINLPTDGGKGVVECLLNKEGNSDFGRSNRCHTAILDQIVEIDEGLMEKYLGGEEPNYDALHAPFERAMDEMHVVPILFTDAKIGVGIEELLDAMARHFPSPMEGNPRPFLDWRSGTRAALRIQPDAVKPLLAHVFKVTTDPFVGKLAIFRVHQGKAAGQHAGVYRHIEEADQTGPRVSSAGQGASRGRCDHRR